MPTLTISGSIAEIRAKLQRMKTVCELRAAEGWPILQHDETWLYTISAEGACPTCAPFDSNTYRGDYMLYEFPLVEALGPTEVLVHNETRFHVGHRCRCTARWVNPHEVLVQRLVDEMESA